MIHILRNSRNASDPFIRAVQVLKQTKLVQIFKVSNSFLVYHIWNMIIDWIHVRTSSGPHPTSGFPASPSKPLHIPNSDPAGLTQS